MNILVFSWRDPKHPLAGGAEQVMHEHMKGWIEAGHTVTLFSSFFDGSKRTETIDGVYIIRRGSQYLGVHILGALHYLFGKHSKYNLVVDQFHGIPFFTPLYVSIPKIAILQEVARDVWLQNDLPFPMDKIIGWIGYIGEPLIFLFYKWTQFIVGSDSAKEDLTKVGIKSENIEVIPHGTIIVRPEPFPKKEKRQTIVFLGALAKDKGIEDALKCFSILNKDGKYNFWVIGKSAPEYLDVLKRKCSEYDIESNIKFWGYVSNSKKFKLLARTHVMINPSLLEGFGLVNIEANAMGTPVVGYTSRGLVDSICHNKSGLLVSPNTPKELAANVKKTLKNVAEYRKLQKSSVEWSKNFSWLKSKRLSLKVIEENTS